MADEHRELANHFGSFVEDLNSLRTGASYHIGVTTMDVSSKGPQGKLIPFSNGRTVISNDPASPYYARNASALFRANIQRPETLTCQQNYYAREHCPGTRERGIEATNRFLDRNYHAFFRSNAHFAIIFLTDADANQDGEDLDEYSLPSTLVSKVQQKLGASKAFSVHGILIRPRDSICYARQRRDCGNWYIIPGSGLSSVTECAVSPSKCYLGTCGYYGNVYNQLIDPEGSLVGSSGLLSGTAGNICSDSYGEQLGSIANGLKTYLRQLTLHCQPINFSYPSGQNVQITLPSGQSHIRYLHDGRKQVSFSEELSQNTNLQIKYRCVRSI